MNNLIVQLDLIASSDVDIFTMSLIGFLFPVTFHQFKYIWALTHTHTHKMTNRQEVEQELRNQFKELQLAVLESKKKIRQMDAQLDMLGKGSLRSKLVRNEITSIVDDVRLYQSLGRMFYLQDKKQIVDTLDKVQEEREQNSKQLQDNKNFLEKSMKDKENSLREFINQNIRAVPVSGAADASSSS